MSIPSGGEGGKMLNDSSSLKEGNLVLSDRLSWYECRLVVLGAGEGSDPKYERPCSPSP
jgi:hypothetical protein